MFGRRPNRTINENVNGVDVEYTVPDTTPIPRLPFNLDAVLRRALFAFAITMTIGAILWGTVAIGSMLTLIAPAWAAYLVAGVFDAGWAACLIAEWLLRYDHKRATTPRNAGVAMLIVSMAAIVMHGALSGPWGWTVGVIGALVSAAAKGVWAIGMHTIRIRLEPKYEAYLRTLQQQSGTEQALALGERDRLLTEDRTVALKLALETRRPSMVTAAEPVNQPADRSESTPVQPPEQSANQIETKPEPTPVQPVQSTVNRTGPPQVEDQVDVLVSMLREGEHVTKKSAAHVLGIPESTAWRRLTKAQSIVNQYN